MPILLLEILLPFAFDAILAYIKSSRTDKDDKILDLTQRSCEYLASQNNNSMNYGHVSKINDVIMVQEVKE